MPNYDFVFEETIMEWEREGECALYRELPKKLDAAAQKSQFFGLTNIQSSFEKFGPLLLGIRYHLMIR